MDMAAGSSRCMGGPHAVAHNDLRLAASELSGGGESVTLRVNSVLLHYLPPTDAQCLIWAEIAGEQISANDLPILRPPDAIVLSV